METEGILVLVRKARDGDRPAWDALFHWAQPYLLNLAARLLLPEWPGESVSHVLGLVWQRGWRGIRQFRGAAVAADDDAAARLLLAWLRQVVRTAVLNGVARANRRHARTLSLSHVDPDSTTPGVNRVSPADEAPPIVTRLTDTEDLARLRTVLGRFEEADRRLVLMIHSGEQSLREIARAMGCPERTLRDRRDRLLKRLRTVMENEAP
ncbi:MAG TPA: hypothetical protein VFW33_07720 [Gemmataceae bacterium]|nr:hypothetical protein [Gemmataceae bacterium]